MKKGLKVLQKHDSKFSDESTKTNGQTKIDSAEHLQETIPERLQTYWLL